MHLPKHLRNPIITGTLLLTAAGLLSRIIGFFYRIFLSRTIGAEGMGIYQLIFPILSLTIALCAAGIQTAISRFVASDQSCTANAGMVYLYSGMVLSITLAFLCSFLLWRCSDFLAVRILDEARTSHLLKVMAYALPCSCVHACINGYYYGRKKTLIPAFTQITEQLVRVVSVYTIFLICQENHSEFTVIYAVWGLVFGEFSSMLIAASCLRFRRYSGQFFLALRKLSRFAIPLTANRVTYHIFAALEAILIPARLKLFGYTDSEALSVFGILNGMALPMILFPSVLTNSVSVLLLPTISEAVAQHNRPLIIKTIRKTFLYCSLLGLVCTLGFLLTGHFIGQRIFHNTLAGTFIVILGWICPFLYLATTFSSILHGLGKATTAFYINLSGCLIRIGCILLFIPRFGIRSYLYSMLGSQLIIALLSGYVLIHRRTHMFLNHLDKRDDDSIEHTV